MKGKTLILWVVLATMPSWLIHPEKKAVLSEIINPSGFVIDTDRFYVIEKTSIFIYSLKDFKLIKKFGKSGEGPGEFKFSVKVNSLKDSLLINSGGKILFFSKDGTYQREIKTNVGYGGDSLLPLKNGFVSNVMSIEKNIFFQNINLYDANLKKVKQLLRKKLPFQNIGKIVMPSNDFNLQVYNNMIFVARGDSFAVEVFDAKGTAMFTIKRNIEKHKFSSKDEIKWRDSLKILSPSHYNNYKSRLTFTKYFPEISSFYINDNKIYITTWKIENGQVEMFVYNTNGKYLKQLRVIFAFQGVLEPNPYVIAGDKIYQLIENEEEEEWELHVNVLN